MVAEVRRSDIHVSACRWTTLRCVAIHANSEHDTHTAWQQIGGAMHTRITFARIAAQNELRAWRIEHCLRYLDCCACEFEVRHLCSLFVMCVCRVNGKYYYRARRNAVVIAAEGQRSARNVPHSPASLQPNAAQISTIRCIMFPRALANTM